jgi:hypothetical protein
MVIEGYGYESNFENPHQKRRQNAIAGMEDYLIWTQHE